MTERFFDVRMVTQGVVGDLMASMRNQVGLRQRGREDAIREAAEELVEQVHENRDVDWYKVDVDPGGTGAIMVTVYGEGEPCDA